MAQFERVRTELEGFCFFVQAATHVKIVAIGVSWHVDEEELKIMAGNRHYVLVDSFEDLSNAMGEVLDKVCT